MEKKKINYYILFNFVLITIIIFGIQLSLMSFISITTKQSFPKILNNAIIKIESDSMLPEFKNDQMVSVTEIKPTKINVGDKIAYYVFYESGGVEKIGFHEVSDIIIDTNNVYFFKIKGTANLDYETNLVHQNSIIGKYNRSNGFLVSIFSFSTSTLGVFLLIITPSIFLVSLQISFATYINKKRNHEIPKYMMQGEQA